MRIENGMVLTSMEGRLEFEKTNQVIAASAQAARGAQTRRVLMDLRGADISGYHSFAVRHAEVAPDLGLDTGFRVAFVGVRDMAEVLSFMERVAQNHGWKARRFFDFDEAREWLAQA